MGLIRPHKSGSMILSGFGILFTASAIMLASGAAPLDIPMNFGPGNPFYKPSTLAFHAPPFDKIKDADYQPAIEAGMAQQRQEIQAIANNPAAPTFENTIVANGKDRRIARSRDRAFDGVAGANLNPELQKVQDIEAPKLAAHQMPFSSTRSCFNVSRLSTTNGIR